MLPVARCLWKSAAICGTEANAWRCLQVVPLPFVEQQAGQCSQPQAPVEPVVMAAMAAAGAKPLQPFEVRALPFRAYAVALTPRYVAHRAIPNSTPGPCCFMLECQLPQDCCTSS